MKPILTALAVVLSLNLFFYLGQMAVININPAASQFYDIGGSWLNQYDAGNYTINQSLTDNLPDAQGGVVGGGEDGNIFTDTFKTFINWFKNKAGAGWAFFDNLINAVPNFLKIMGLPPAVSFALGWFWHVFVFFLILMFWKGDT